MERDFSDMPLYKQAIDAVDSDATLAIRDQSSIGVASVIDECHESKRRAEGDLGTVMDALGTGKVKAETVDSNVDRVDRSSDGGDPSVVVALQSTIKEAEDANDPGDGCLATEPEVHAGDGDLKEKGNAKAVYNDAPLSKVEYLDIVRPPPRRPGWGRDFRENVLHTVPQSHGEPGRERCIFRQWPRHPQGMPIVQGQPKGKQSPDGYPWGATLYDFYAVHPNPSDCREVLHLTGSALLEEMKALGEMDTAVREIEWAMSEGQPRDEGVADTRELIQSGESCVNIFTGRTWGVDWHAARSAEDEDEERAWKSGEIKEDVVDHASIPPPLTIPLTSPFHPSHYPNSWPRTPFKRSARHVLLQERIPLHLLPRKLYIHDPFNLLSARDRVFNNKIWISQPEVVRTYNLRFIGSVNNEIKEVRKKENEVEEFKARTLIVLRYERTKEQIKNLEPMIEVPLPPYQRRPTKIEEGHLYISPAARVGDGHHSIVYKGEWELPRDLFVRPTLCSECFKKSMDKEIQRLKDIGRWKKMLRVAAWRCKGFTGRQPTRAELEEVNDAQKLEQNGEIVEREVTCVIPPDMSPSAALHLIDEYNVWNFFMENPKRNTALIDFVARLDKDGATNVSNVAVIRINPPFSYDSQKDCTHGPRAFPTPRTTKFTVIAKLSLEGDQHLLREAINYQQFPEHFFRHYNGYTIIPQLPNIVPVHAIVPQYYGYYTPQTDSGKLEGRSYLSPVLLLEHCGQPIDPKTLSTDDQEECTSMLLRFQRAGWLHESIVPRNFLVQEGPPTEFPLQRNLIRRELSFRLIDFGRSRKYTKADEKRSEEMEATTMFAKLS